VLFSKIELGECNKASEVFAVSIGSTKKVPTPGPFPQAGRGEGMLPQSTEQRPNAALE
jgi:hypothetical protein